MKVKELIEELKKVDPEREVIMAKDDEGNGFSPLADFSQDLYVPHSTWSGEIHIEELTEELKKYGYTEEDMYNGNDGVKALVLWPVN